jgi:hypothetical protein
MIDPAAHPGATGRSAISGQPQGERIPRDPHSPHMPEAGEQSLGLGTIRWARENTGVMEDHESAFLWSNVRQQAAVHIESRGG